MREKNKRSLIAICLAFFIWFQGNYKTIEFSEQLKDLGYSNIIINKISSLTYKEKLRFIKQKPPKESIPLLTLFLEDGFFSPNESEILDLIQLSYNKKILSEKQNQFFFHLSSLNHFKNFFSFGLSLEEIELTTPTKNILDPVTIEVFQKNETKLPILMYHTLDGTKEGISYTTFIKHLNLLYNAGFTTLKLDDFYRGDYSNIPNGRKPIIITFDDSWISQFSYLDPQGSKIDPTCAVGILEEFAKNNPLFGKSAAFFLYMSILPFTLSIGGYEQSQLWKKKLIYLQENGFEIGCHTFHHKYLGDATDHEVKNELDSFYNSLKSADPKLVKKSMYFAYPGGIYPKNMKTIEDYTYDGYSLKLSLTAYGGYANVLFHSENDPHKITRILGEDEQIKEIIKHITFTKYGYKITLPQLFLQTNKFLCRWIEEKTSFKTKYLLADPNILYTICAP